METKTKIHYKYCIVPKCTNTTVTTPDKHFFTVPKQKKIRAKWCKIMKRKESLSEKSVRYCCEDHFDVEKDTENFMRHRFVGGRLLLKKQVLPHKFACQKTKENTLERSAVAKRRRAEYYEKVLSIEVPASVAQQPIEFIECVQSDEEIKDPESPISVPTERFDVDMEASIKIKTKNKGTQVNMMDKKEDIGCQTRYGRMSKKFSENKILEYFVDNDDNISETSDTVNRSPMALDYDTIVVGLGASGVSCASQLAQAGRRVLGLEAQSRLGGRVHTVPLGDGIAELGAEWIHGTDGSSVYKMAVKNNVRVLPQDLNFKMYKSDGSVADSEVVTDLMYYCLGLVEDPPQVPEPLGQYLTRRVQAYISTEYPHLQNDTDFIQSFLNFMDLVINNYESSDSWLDVSTMSFYEELAGHQHVSWHAHGYSTLFDIMLNKYNNGPGLPTLSIKLNAEVTRIKWPKNSTGPVEVTTADGNTHRAQNVVVTVSLGVLKERHSTLFSPPLPQAKISLIERLSIGVVDKITFLFEHAWWPKEGNFFGFLWREADRTEPCDEWTRQIFACSSPLGHGRALTAWTSGDGAKLVEGLPDDVVRRKVLEVIRRFMGGAVTIPEPVEMIRSRWYSNRFTRGSYSYDNTLTPQMPDARKQLGTPLGDSEGTPRVLFAGEATDPVHFSTVHGAVDAGRREASRLLKVHSKM